MDENDNGKLRLERVNRMNISNDAASNKVNDKSSLIYDNQLNNKITVFTFLVLLCPIAVNVSSDYVLCFHLLLACGEPKIIMDIQPLVHSHFIRFYFLKK